MSLDFCRRHATLKPVHVCPNHGLSAVIMPATFKQAAEQGLITASMGDDQINARPGTVRNWAHRGKMTQRGTIVHHGRTVPLYSLADVLTVDRDTRLSRHGGLKRSA